MSSGANSAAKRSLTPTLFSKTVSKSSAVSLLVAPDPVGVVYFFCKSLYIACSDEGGRIVSKPWWVCFTPRTCRASRRLSVPLLEIPTANTCIWSLRVPMVGGGRPYTEWRIESVKVIVKDVQY